VPVIVRNALEDHHRRCRPALVRLRMLMSEAEAVTLTDGLQAEMALLMDEVMAELRAADRVLVGHAAQTRRSGPVATFLGCRLARLEAATWKVQLAWRSSADPVTDRA
jgi:hypothetical protein